MRPSIRAVGVARRRCEAFSLVEVVIAIGIVAFAVVAIIGALPVGLKSVKDAEGMQATSNIANQLRGQMQLLSFNASGVNTIQQLAATNLYYTTDGIPSSSSSASTYYRASFTPTSVASTCSINAINAQCIQVSLSYPPGVWNQTNAFSLLVARQTDN